MKLIESFHGEDVEASTIVDEGSCDCNVADGGSVEHGERVSADRSLGVIPRVKGNVDLGRHPA